jgi:hypothetical protein
VSPPAKLLPIDRRLLDLLAAHQGPAGICPTMTRLAGLVGVTRRYVRERLATLEAAGLVERVAVFERDDDLEWKRRRAAGFAGERPRRQTSNAYRLTGAATPVPTPLGTGPAAVQQHLPLSTPRNSPNSARSPVPPIEGVSGSSGECRHQGPTRSEVLASLNRAFGPVWVVAEWPNGRRR